MKKKLFSSLIVVMCLIALMTLSSCDVLLDFLFGPKVPSEPQHTHIMSKITVENTACTGQPQIDYWQCSECEKCYVDEDGILEIVDVEALSSGHVYILQKNDDQHWRECYYCHEEQSSRQAHSSDKWIPDNDFHIKRCDVCNVEMDRQPHDMQEGKCVMCGSLFDYVASCNSRYGYEFLGTLTDGAQLQKLYSDIDKLVSDVHGDASYNAQVVKDSDNQQHYTLDALNFNKYNLTKTQAMTVMSTFRNDNPLYYWISNSVLTMGDVSIIICVDEDYANGNARVEQNGKLYEQINDYLSIAHNEEDDYYVTLALHNAIIDDIDYAFDGNGEAETALWAHSIVGVFDNKSAVCEGYAKAYQLLLNAMQIENVYVTGASKNVGHAWNLIRLNNEWYWYDITWDDQPNEVGGKIYNYFCKTNSVFLRDHIVSPPQEGIDYLYEVPQASDNAYRTDGVEVDETFTVNGFTFKLSGYNTVSLESCQAAETIVIPETVTANNREYSVTQIGSSAFNSCKLTVKSITIPKTIEIIATESLATCIRLKEVVFTDVNGWSKYAQNGNKPVYEAIDATRLSNAAFAAAELKQSYSESFLSKYPYVWVKD